MDYNYVTSFIVGCAGAAVGIGGAMVVIVSFYWLADKIFSDTEFGKWICGKKNQ